MRQLKGLTLVSLSFSRATTCIANYVLCSVAERACLFNCKLITVNQRSTFCSFDGRSGVCSKIISHWSFFYVSGCLNANIVMPSGFLPSYLQGKNWLRRHGTPDVGTDLTCSTRMWILEQQIRNTFCSKILLTYGAQMKLSNREKMH